MRVLNWDTNQATAILSPLTAATTFYVDSVNGNNNNNGNAPVQAFQTLQAAYNYISTNYDFGGQTVTLQNATGQSLTNSLTINSPWSGGGELIIDLGGSTISNSTNWDIGVFTPTPPLIVQNGTFEMTGGTACIYAANPGSCIFVGSNVVFGVTTSTHIIAVFNAQVQLLESYAISGGAFVHLNSSSNSTVFAQSGITVTVSNTPNFSGEFALAQYNSTIYVAGVTYSGAATGTRYLAQLNGVIETGGGGANFLPGNAGGSATTGGQYG